MQNRAWPPQTVTDEEADRHRHTAAVAQRIALHEATIALDAKRVAVEKANPGRAKKSVTKHGAAMAAVAKECADLVWALMESIDVPQHGDVFVPNDVHDRSKLEHAVARLSPGSYPSLSALTEDQTNASR